MKSQHPGFQARGNDCLHQGLTGFEIFATDSEIFFLGKSSERWNIDGKIRRTVSEWNSRLQGSVSVDHRRRDRLMVVAHSLLKSFERLVNRVLLEKNLSRCRPNHHQTRAAILLLPFGDFG